MRSKSACDKYRGGPKMTGLCKHAWQRWWSTVLEITVAWCIIPGWNLIQIKDAVGSQCPDCQGINEMRLCIDCAAVHPHRAFHIVH